MSINRTANNHRPKLFFSYSHTDNAGNEYHRKLLEHIKTALQFTDAFIDYDIPGDAFWRKTIDEKLAQTTHLILILTPNAVFSEYITYEWVTAFVTGVRIIVIQSPFHPGLTINDIPRPLQNFNILQDPISIPTEQGKLNSALQDSEAVDYTQVWLALESDVFQSFRQKTEANWEAGLAQLETWLTSDEADPEKMAQVKYLLEKIAPLSATEKHKWAIAQAAMRVQELMAFPERRQPLREQDMADFRKHVRLTAKMLREQQVPGAAIRQIIGGLVKAKYGEKGPPRPRLNPGQEFWSGQRECGLCRLKDAQADHNGCCTTEGCGLFYTFWDPNIPDSEDY
jgi:hypothetical protein